MTKPRLRPVEVLVPESKALRRAREVEAQLKRKGLNRADLVLLESGCWYPLDGKLFWREVYGAPEVTPALEQDLKASVCALLDARRLHWDRLQSGKVQVKGGWLRGSAEGTPDLLVRVPPFARMLAIETKASHPDTCGCSSCKAQRQWAQAHLADGGWYLRARSVADVEACLRTLGSEP